MARIMNPIKGIVSLLKGLSGGYDEELDDEKLDENLQRELKEIENLSAKNLRALENSNGNQTMKIEEDGNAKTDRLGIEKPKKTGKTVGKEGTKQTKSQVEQVGKNISERE